MGVVGSIISVIALVVASVALGIAAALVMLMADHDDSDWPGGPAAA